MSSINTLAAISPIDGRYSESVYQLREYFSEYALFKMRVEIELKYLIFLSSIKIVRAINKKEEMTMTEVYKNFSLKDAERIKKIEIETKHDVKAIEYYLRTKLEKDLLPWIHFGLTSYDINDNAYRLLLLRALKKIIIPEIKNILSILNSLSNKYSKLPMLARTHGQPAVPTTFGKELNVFASRISKEFSKLQKIQFYGKFGGAVGNWNSLVFAFPNKDWVVLSKKFLQALGLKHCSVTTQVAPPEDLIELFQNLFRTNSIILDLDQDLWRYISDDWIVQLGKEDDVGSSTMPQKINPIEFENSEGNLAIANGLFETISRKLPQSRLQRDLSDSTVLRNIGVALSHSFLAYKSLEKGLLSISANKQKIIKDLNQDWGILTEALQTLLRIEGNTEAYEEVAKYTRGRKISKVEWQKLVRSLNLEVKIEKKLLKLTPENYLGYADNLEKYEQH